MTRSTFAANPAAALALVNGYSLEMTGKNVPGLLEAKDSIPAGTKIKARGAYVERAVLSRAVQWHAEDRVIRHGNQTIVFD